MVHLENELLVMVAVEDDYQHMVLVDISKRSIGILMSVHCQTLLIS